MVEKGLVLPAYDYTLKTSHTFNLLDARGAISVTETDGIYLKGEDVGTGVCKGLPHATGGDGVSFVKETMINGAMCN